MNNDDLYKAIDALIGQVAPSNSGQANFLFGYVSWKYGWAFFGVLILIIVLMARK